MEGHFTIVHKLKQVLHRYSPEHWRAWSSLIFWYIC